jgi:integrase
LASYEKVKAKYSKHMAINVTGGHLLQWQKNMQDRKLSKKQVKESIAQVICLAEGCGFTVPSDIDGEKMKNWLAETQETRTASVANSALRSFKTFTFWMLRTGRISQNPIRDVQAFKQLERKRMRRALTMEEIQGLIVAANAGGTHHGLSGEGRALVYRVALSTGFRYNEIRTLVRKDVAFGSKPSVTIRAGNAKNRKADTLPLAPELAEDLEAYLASKLAMPHIPVFKMWKDKGASMLKIDLEAADILYSTDVGVADFHALRHTFGTLLAQLGVSPQETQKLMRHSDINLTMNTYTHITLLDKAKAISKLPSTRPQEEKMVRTGTNDTPEGTTVYSTENSVKLREDPVKNRKGEARDAEGGDT